MTLAAALRENGRGYLWSLEVDANAARLATDGVTQGDIEQVTSSRILRLADPDGNSIVIAGQ